MGLIVSEILRNDIFLFARFSEYLIVTDETRARDRQSSLKLNSIMTRGRHREASITQDAHQLDAVRHIR